jgi:hypothetical protein
MTDIIYSKNENGIEVKFNSSHYIEVRKKHPLKKVLNCGNKYFPQCYHEGHQIIEHPLLYKVVQENKTGTLYIVSRVLKTFYCGWYYTCMLQQVNESSCIRTLCNINSLNEKNITFYEDYTITNITVDEFFNGKIQKFNEIKTPAIDWFLRTKKLNDLVIQWFQYRF